MTTSIQANGYCEIQTAKGLGLPLGKYRVAVGSPLPKFITGRPYQSPTLNFVPTKYQRLETSGLTIAVQAGENPLDLHLVSATK